jgi:hypothetical protein
MLDNIHLPSLSSANAAEKQFLPNLFFIPLLTKLNRVELAFPALRSAASAASLPPKAPFSPGA